MIDPRRYARVMGYSHGQATGHSRRAAHRQATGGQATAMQGRFRHASIWPAVCWPRRATARGAATVFGLLLLYQRLAPR